MRKNILLVTGIFIALIMFLYLAIKIDFYISFVRLNSINIVSMETKSCDFTIPVKYIDNKRSDLPGKAIYTPEKERYSLRYSNTDDKLLITVNKMAWYGLTIFRARYEITDKNIHAKLLELYKNNL